VDRASSRKILIVGAGFLQSFAIRRAREMGLLVVAIDRDPSAPGFRWCHRQEIADTRDAEACREAAEAAEKALSRIKVEVVT